MSDNILNGVHGCTQEDQYVAPTDPLIRERLEWFRDQKLALMMHYGPYSCIGIDASWSLSRVDEWARTEVDWESDFDAYREQYVHMYKCFDPIRFQPEKWADIATENGFKYLIFTTKHHDGFCMFDTRYTDYKITASDCPFHTNKNADIVKAVFDAFRARGLAVGAYFSKPDWHCPWYWAEGMDRPVSYSRYPTYDPVKHPEIWNKFTEFTHAQIMELIENYGRIDILWLDGGQVNPALGLDIRLSDVVAKARKIQPWLITADRTVGGENENYITPECSLPEDVIRVPWETCLTSGTSWGYKFGDKYKSSRELVHILIQVVAFGGNLALNVGPQPNGELPPEAIKEISGLGGWLKTNGEAIYGTRLNDVAKAQNVYFTKKGGAVYALLPLGEDDLITGKLFLPCPAAKRATYLATGEKADIEAVNGGVELVLSKPVSGKDSYAAVFKIES